MRVSDYIALRDNIIQNELMSLVENLSEGEQEDFYNKLDVLFEKGDTFHKELLQHVLPEGQTLEQLLAGLDKQL